LFIYLRKPGDSKEAFYVLRVKLAPTVFNHSKVEASR